MGDSGSMFLGYSLAVISVTGTHRHLSGLMITMFIPVLILCVPIFDTAFVMIGRTVQGRRIFEGGKDHTSHRLVTLGLTQRKTVLLLYLISVVFGLIALSYTKLNFLIVSIIAFLAVLIMVFFGLFLFEDTSAGFPTASRGPLSDEKARQTVLIPGYLMHKRRIIEVLLDFLLICIAYYSAYYLRFEGPLLASNLFLLRESILWIILIKMTVFFLFGLYRGAWRYIGISDFFTIFKVTSIGSVASVLFLTFVFRFREYSRAVFFIDWLLLLFLVMGSRFLFRIFGEFFSRVRSTGRKVVIFGAGDTGEMVVRELKRNRGLGCTAVGFIDDDPKKLGVKIHGVPVLGNRSGLARIIKARGIEEVIIAVSRLPSEIIQEIVTVCEDNGIAFRKVKGILE